jgi:hypothetical protein
MAVPLLHASAILLLMTAAAQAGDSENRALYQFLTSNAPIPDQVAAVRKHFTSLMARLWPRSEATSFSLSNPIPHRRW